MFTENLPLLLKASVTKWLATNCDQLRPIATNCNQLRPIATNGLRSVSVHSVTSQQPVTNTKNEHTQMSRYLPATIVVTRQFLVQHLQPPCKQKWSSGSREPVRHCPLTDRQLIDSHFCDRPFYDGHRVVAKWTQPITSMV